MLATVVMLFRSFTIVVPQQVVVHLARLRLQTYITNLAQQ
jgi:hypothetical protein